MSAEVTTCAETPPIDAAALVESWAESLELAVVWDRDGRILSCNNAFARKFGAREEWVGRPFGEKVHPDDSLDWRNGITRIDMRPWHVSREHRWQTVQGWRWIAWEETGLRNADGEVWAVRSIGRDVTKRRLGEEHFSKLAKAIDQSPTAVVLSTPQGQVQYVNPRYTEISGLTLEEIFEKEIEVLGRGFDDPGAYRDVLEQVRRGGSWSGEVCSWGRDEKELWEFVQITPIRNHADEVVQFLCLREDITQRKTLELQLRQAQKMESLGTLAGGIAHDFNNIIAIVKGYTEFCLGRTEDASLQRYLTEIHKASHRAVGLVRQILTFSRKAEVSTRPVDINALLNELGRLFSETFPRTIEFQFDLQKDLPSLMADPNQLQQVIMNLCVNARDAMGEGGRLRLSSKRVRGSQILDQQNIDPKRDYVCITIADNGHGMPPDVRARIFEPFFTTKMKKGGTGLGLSVVYGIVVNHQGALTVDSTPGKGTTFRAFFPIIETKKAGSSDAEGTSQPVPRGTEHLLIVEDEESLRELLSTAMTELGYTVETAEHGLAAAERLLNGGGRDLDAILLDLNLPGMNGIEVLRSVRRIRPSMPVIIISGNVGREQRDQLNQLGVGDVIVKPYSLADIGQRLRSVLERR
ncbi:hybrid sensor histidine kinase/response regulator [Actomonas aquatica]|uniref:histidine kinase n=1 Tax=Actomonas aquatica TaxID=2866162 RepID=A0ABZ1CCS6_9BACT|nr:PAS domain-containing sensor histidine kinase [Opitutus sp. WL0086]WRQ89298.1 ATP-binding protein [Opitutus sp. WL0086]